MTLHSAKQGDGSADIDAPVLEGDLARLSNCFQGSEVDDIVDVWVLLEDLVERALGCDVDVVEFWPLAADELYAVDALF